MRFGARRNLPRTRTLLQLLVMDEFESLGRRPDAGDRVTSAAQADAAQSFLAEMDGMIQDSDSDAHLLVAGMSNRPDMIDIAIKRPGRMGDLVIEMPDLDLAGAEKVCADLRCAANRFPSSSTASPNRVPAWRRCKRS